MCHITEAELALFLLECIIKMLFLLNFRPFWHAGASLPMGSFQKSEDIAMHLKEPGGPLLIKLIRSYMAHAIFSSKRHLQATGALLGLPQDDLRPVLIVTRLVTDERRSRLSGASEPSNIS